MGPRIWVIGVWMKWVKRKPKMADAGLISDNLEFELWKGVVKKEKKLKPETADTGYQIIGICRNSRLDYFPVFAGYLHRITIQGNLIKRRNLNFR